MRRRYCDQARRRPPRDPEPNIDALRIHWYRYDPRTRRSQSIPRAAIRGILYPSDVPGAKEQLRRDEQPLLRTGRNDDLLRCAPDSPRYRDIVRNRVAQGCVSRRITEAEQLLAQTPPDAGG